MSDEEKDGSRKKTKREQSDGQYKAKKPHGLTSKFQASWYDPPTAPGANIGLRMVVLVTTMTTWQSTSCARPASRVGQH
eukprot:997641-Pelagomonas_calceolata.AAC.5